MGDEGPSWLGALPDGDKSVPDGSLPHTYSDLTRVRRATRPELASMALGREDFNRRRGDERDVPGDSPWHS